MEVKVLSIEEATKIFSKTISNLKETTVNPCGARLLAREMRDFLKKWLPEIKLVKTKESAKNRNSQDFLFQNLFETSALLQNSVFERVSSHELVSDVYELMTSIYLYSQNALHQVSLKTFFTSLSTVYALGSENELKAQLEKEPLLIKELRLLATIKNEQVVLTSSELEDTEIMDDSEFLLACTQTSDIFKSDVKNRISQIIQKLIDMDRKDQPIKDKDLDALAVFSIKFLTAFVNVLTRPEIRDSIINLILNGAAEAMAPFDFLADLNDCADLLKKQRL